MSASPHITARVVTTDDKESIDSRLALEEKLQAIGEELLEAYTGKKDWGEVGELAQTLRSNSRRIKCLKNSLLSGYIDMSTAEGGIKITPLGGNEWMVEILPQNKQFKRNLEDFNHLRDHLCKEHCLLMPPSLIGDASSLQEILSIAVKNIPPSHDTVLNCFLSPNVVDFSVVCKDLTPEQSAAVDTMKENKQSQSSLSSGNNQNRETTQLEMTTPEIKAETSYNVEVPIEETPVPDVPIEETPVPDVPIEETPVPEVPIEETPVPEVPIEETPVPEVPIEETPVPEVPIEETPVPEVPIEETPVPEVPIEETPVPEVPIEETPVPEVPIEETPVPEVPIEETPVPEVPIEETPVPEVPIEETPVPEVPIEETPVPEVPIEETPVPEVPIEETPVPEVPIEETPVPEVPIEETPVPEVPIEETPVPEVPIEEKPVPEIPIEETQDCSYQEDTSNNTSSEALIEESSSDVLIEDLERSPPQISKRIESSPPVTSTTTTTTINTAVIKAMDPINSSATKTSSESDEMSSGGTERKPLAIRSNSVFYDDKTSPLLIEAAKPGKVKQSKTFRKSKKKDLENALSASPDVSLLAPVQTMHWDPTCLLEELYNDCRPGTAHPSGAETCRYSGYLDKLPVNQRKPSVIKGWKHRFFKLTRGSLFYFDDANASKATSFIRLSDSRIVLHSDSLKLEIVEKGGNFILLRVDNRTDFNTWHRHLQLEAVHPTMTHRVNISPTPVSPVIIVDLGSSSVRAGLLSDDTSYPQLFFPNVCAANGDTIIACGNGALLPETRKDTKSIHPCRHRMRYDSTLPIRNCYQYIFETICKLLHVEPHKMSVLVSISPAMSTNEQTELAEVLLEVLGFKSILFQEQTTLALYSYNNTSGIVVNVGDSTHVTPIIDGFKIDSGSSYSPFGGHNITENLSKLATAKDIRYFSESEMYIVRYIKENICFISQNFAEDTMKCEESSVEYVRAIDVDRFQLPDHRKVIHLDSASFKAPEGLFTPGLWGKDTIGLHEMVQKAIDHCPMDMRRLMCKHIYLGGGTTLLDGFQERLEKELRSLYPRMDVQVHADDNRHHAAFLGGAILASLNSFSKSLVDLDNWTANGLEAMKQTANT